MACSDSVKVSPSARAIVKSGAGGASGGIVGAGTSEAPSSPIEVDVLSASGCEAAADSVLSTVAELLAVDCELSADTELSADGEQAAATVTTASINARRFIATTLHDANQYQRRLLISSDLLRTSSAAPLSMASAASSTPDTKPSAMPANTSAGAAFTVTTSR
jgi:hypothetical protein